MSYLEYDVLLMCAESPYQDADSPSELRLLRVVKPLRLFKLLRIVRAFKFMTVFERLQSFLQLPVVVFRLTKLLILTLYMVHVCACIYWIVKEASMTEDEMLLFHTMHRYGFSLVFLN